MQLLIVWKLSKGLYLPPSASGNLLYQLVYATDNILIFGDFNVAPDPGLYRLSQTSSSDTDLASWVEASNFTDVYL